MLGGIKENALPINKEKSSFLAHKKSLASGTITRLFLSLFNFKLLEKTSHSCMRYFSSSTISTSTRTPCFAPKALAKVRRDLIVRP